MNTNARLVLTALVVIVVLVVSCAPSPTSEPREAGGVAEEQVVEIVHVAATAPATPVPAAIPVSTTDASDESTLPHSVASTLSRPDRLIVKNAELKSLVSETDVAIDLTTQVAADCAGYIISSRVWYEQWAGTSYKYATITIGVPVDQFERAMRRLRGLALRVVDETASGQDVTDE